MNAARSSLVLWAFDLALLTGAIYLASWAKWTLPLGQAPDPGTRFISPAVLLLLLIAWSVHSQVTALYRRPLTTTLPTQVHGLAITMILTVLTLAAALMLLKYHFFSRLVLVYLFGLSLFLMAMSRVVLWKVWAAWLARLSAVRRVLIVGSGELARRVADSLKQDSWSRVHLVGTVADAPPHPDVLFLGTCAEVRSVVQGHRVNEVVIAERDRPTVLSIVRALEHETVRVRIIPDYLELASVAATVTWMGPMPLLELRAPAIQGVDAFVKRVFDLVGASSALMLLSPAILVAALAVKLTSPGPVLFRQVRVGENGRVFHLYKLRTMTLDAPATPPLPGRPDLLGQSQVKVEPNSPYITPVGRFLRRFGLDELPQLFNVLEGEMSMVGPRPEVPAVVEIYTSWHLKRLAAKPGITGPMQVSGAADLSIDERVKLELAYLQNYSVWEDVKFLARTLPAILRGEGIH